MSTSTTQSLMELKTTILAIGAAVAHNNDARPALQAANAILTDLPKTHRLLVRPKPKVNFKIYGWLADQPDGAPVHRATITEVNQSFWGVKLDFGAEANLILKAGTAPHSPWCELPFSPEGQPSFELALLTSETFSNHAVYI